MGTPASASAKASVLKPFSELSLEDILFAGGKGANLGVLTNAGFPVPPGFVIGAPAYVSFCNANGLSERIASTLTQVDVDNTQALQSCAQQIRSLIECQPIPDPLIEQIRCAYLELCPHEEPVAIRSSATAEDTSSASFAGMNETLLNVRGFEHVLTAIRRCWSSLFSARTIFYRANRRILQAKIDIAVIVQQQIAATRAGVMFTVDPVSGNQNWIVIEGSFGLGEPVVSGQITPDRYVVDKKTGAILSRNLANKNIIFEPDPERGTTTRNLLPHDAFKPTLSDEEASQLAELGNRIEQHYGAPQDTEWAYDEKNRLWMLQSRPITAIGELQNQKDETLANRSARTTPSKNIRFIDTATVLLRGLGAAPGIGSGSVHLVKSQRDAAGFRSGEILVAPMTTPDWVPIIRRAAAVVTDSGGTTCHAAIVSRELGIPCVVGTANATTTLKNGQAITVDATQGLVTEGLISENKTSPRPARTIAPKLITATKLLLNLSEPSQVEHLALLDVDGVGLLRAEIMVMEALEGRHPRVLIEAGQGDEFVERMGQALTTFATGFNPRPVTYRTIDFRTNEFRGLHGGERFEPQEANPMIGYRGAFRYTHEPDLFQLELRALNNVRKAGHTNLHLMLPFVRTKHELKICCDLIQEAGLLTNHDFELWIMAEVPSVLFVLERYAELPLTGVSIGSNDLTQLLLGADRDSEQMSEVFDECDPAVTTYITQLIAKAHQLGLRTSICGQAPSVHPEYIDLLVNTGIDAISVNSDTVTQARNLIATAEQRTLLQAARNKTP